MMEDKEKKYKWHLRWSGMPDTEVNRRKAEYCKVVTLAKDSQCHLIGHDEYQEMIKKEEIAPPRSYWQIRDGEIGLINLSCYNQYLNTWDAVNQAAEDYAAGWRECKKYMDQQAMIAKIPADHAEAIKMSREFKKYGYFPDILKFRCRFCNKRFTAKYGRNRETISCPNCKCQTELELLERKGE
jgi:hypothetical protein